MNELIKVMVSDKHEQIVSGRELHEFLEVKDNYTDWMKRIIEYGFEANQDFIGFLRESNGGRPSFEHHIKMDMAKEICMITRNEKGKQARKYFIEIEKAWNDPNMVMARSLQFAQSKLLNFEETVKALEFKIEQNAPKVLFADAVTTAQTTVLVGDLAKILNQNGYNIGANRLFEELRNRGFLIRRKGSDWNMPTQKSMDLGLFEIKETAVAHSDGHTTVNKTSKVTGKGQVYFVNYFMNIKSIKEMKAQ